MHYERWRLHGDPLHIRPTGLDLLAEFVDASGDCWEWMGTIGTRGYGYLMVGGARWLAHRWVWTELIGPIPRGLVIDHLCRNTSCVNPAHLETVTSTVNNQRSESVPARNARKRKCKHGHIFTESNTYITPRGRRDCKTCRADAQERLKERTRLASV